METAFRLIAASHQLQHSDVSEYLQSRRDFASTKMLVKLQTPVVNAAFAMVRR